MKRKFSLILVACLLLPLATGCTNKTFGMPIEDLRTEINANIQSLGYDITVPEFGNESDYTGKDTKNESYVSYINDNFLLAISPPEGMIGSSASILFDPPTEEKFTEQLPDFIAVVSAFIMTVDPEADVQEVLDALDLNSTEEIDELKFKTDDFTYKSGTRLHFKWFVVEQFPIEAQDE